MLKIFIIHEFHFSSPMSIAFNLKMGHRVKKIRERLDQIAAADKSNFNLIDGVPIPNAPDVLSEREVTHSVVIHTIMVTKSE